jgi:two-component system, chemotaxis family, protein-glutamate methylesterase/glutaminase
MVPDGDSRGQKEAINHQRIVRDVIVLGGSRGSHAPLISILASLPADFPAIVGVVLHRGPSSFYDWAVTLGQKSHLQVTDGVQGELLKKGCVYLAPSDRHMTFADGRIQLATGAKEHYTRPAVDPLFLSAAQEYGQRVVGVVLSGGGEDGTLGLLAITRGGGLSLIQRPSEAERVSMPEHAARHDHVNAALHVDEIGEVLVALARGAAVLPRAFGQDAQQIQKA